MSDVKKITVEIGECEKLERLHYEYESSKDIIASALDIHRMDSDASFLDSPVFKKFQERSTAKFREYTEAKDELVEKYNLKGINWQLNFKDREVTVG